MFKEISAYSKISVLVNRHPVEKIMLSIFPIIILGFCYNYVPIIINLAVFIVLHYRYKTPKHIVAKFTVVTTIFALFSSITFITDYGIWKTGIIILKTLNGGLSLSYLVLSTPLDQILKVISKFKAMREVCAIAKSMERFIFIIEDEYYVLVNAVKCRGGFSGYKNRVIDGSRVAGLLFVNTLERWKDVNHAVSSRCYRGYIPCLKENLDYSSRRLIVIIGYNILLLLCIPVISLIYGFLHSI
jgi:cobalt/nickel transport system permease protein